MLVVYGVAEAGLSSGLPVLLVTLTAPQAKPAQSVPLRQLFDVRCSVVWCVGDVGCVFDGIALGFGLTIPRILKPNLALRGF